MQKGKTNLFGAELARIIEGMQVTQTQFGAPLGLDASRVSGIIRGAKPVGIDLLERIVQGLTKDEGARLVAAYMEDRLPEKVRAEIQIIASQKGRIPERIDNTWKKGMRPETAAAFEFLHNIHAENPAMDDLVLSLAQALGMDEKS